MPTVTHRESARRDLVDHFDYLAENAGLDTAERFLANAEASFNLDSAVDRSLPPRRPHVY